ncbi:MAG: protoporphyrinogen oxidase [Acidobacteriota bacterium]
MTDRLDVLVLGGGISGLTAAFLLQKRGLSVRLLEAAERPGGCITTWRKDGFLFELGPNTVLNNAREIDRLCEEAGLLQDRLEAFPAARKRCVVKGGRLVALPAGPLGFLATPLFSLRAKVRLLKEPFIPPAPPGREESIATFVRRRLGPELLDYAVAPFVSGVYAGDPEALSVRHAVAKIHALEQEHGSLIRGALARRKGPAPQGGLFSFRDGLETLPRRLALALGEGYTAPAAVLSVRREGEAFSVVFCRPGGEGERMEARAVVSALPAAAASAVLAPLGGEFPQRVRDLPYADVALVCLGFRRQEVAHPLDGFGFLAPEVERRFVLGCLFPSSLFPGRAPGGHVALSAFAGGAVHPERASLGEEELVRETLRDLAPLLGLRGSPVLSRVARWRPAIPQYNLGHGDFLRAARQLEEAHPGLFVSGNLLYGVSVGNCIQNAFTVAERVETFLRRGGEGAGQGWAISPRGPFPR